MITATTTFTSPDPDVVPTTYGESVLGLNAVVTTVINEEVTPYILSIEVPAVEDQDKAWIRKNTLGNPVGTYIFSQGVWVREEPVVSARFGIFTGDPTDLFDSTGRGLKGAGPIALDYWGWALMNGANGTQNWSNRFLIGGGMDNDGIIGFGSGGWRTNINGEEESTGGNAEITLDADNTYFTGIQVGRHEADGSAVDGGGSLYGTGTDTTLGTPETEPLAISVVPPFVAVAWIQFIGYL